MKPTINSGFRRFWGFLLINKIWWFGGNYGKFTVRNVRKMYDGDLKMYDGHEKCTISKSITKNANQ